MAWPTDHCEARWLVCFRQNPKQDLAYSCYFRILEFEVEPLVAVAEPAESKLDFAVEPEVFVEPILPGQRIAAFVVGISAAAIEPAVVA